MVVKDKLTASPYPANVFYKYYLLKTRSSKLSLLFNLQGSHLPFLIQLVIESPHNVGGERSKILLSVHLVNQNSWISDLARHKLRREKKELNVREEK